MKIIVKTAITLLFAAALAGCCNSDVKSFCLEKAGEMPGIEQGFEQGVSACYAAIDSNTIYIAGGCNFPETPAAEGGSKRYYKGIFKSATGKQFEWEQTGELPEPSAYGVNIQHEGKWYIIGGMNSDSALNSTYSIDITTMSIEKLPSLPFTIDNAAGAAAGNTLFVAGGNCDGKASNRVLAMDIDCDSAWRELPPMPGPARVQPVCASDGKNLFVWGGFTPANAEGGPAVHCDGARFDIEKGEWHRLENVIAGEEEITLSGGYAIAIENGRIAASGGVNKEIFLDAISGKYKLVRKEEYMYKPEDWYRFNNRLMIYDTSSGKWSVADCNSSYARAGAVFAKERNTLYQIGGELKPGIRTPGIYRITIAD